MAARVRRLRALSFLTLLRERAAVAFWRPVCWVMLFAGLWLWELPARLGDAGSLAALALFVAGTAWSGARGVRAYRHPRRAEIDRRMEEAAGLPHRPLAQVGDVLSNPEKEETRRLWGAEKFAAWRALAALRRAKPRPVMAAADPLALRLVALLVLGSGIVAAGGAWKERIAFGLLPFSVHWQDRVTDNIALWITPPAYTGLPQVTLQGRGRATQAVDMPEGSVIRARVREGWGRPHFVMGARDLPMDELGKDSWGLEVAAGAAEDIRIRQLYLTRAVIPVNYVPDRPPVITLRHDPKVTPRGTLQAGLGVRDDYGVGALTMRMELASSSADPPMGAPVTETRPVMSAPGKEEELRPVYDLTGHTWAGLPVALSFTVRDRAGHEAALPPIYMTLPERSFYHPVARKIAALRKRLIWTPEAAAENVAYEIEHIMARPDEFEHDAIAFLALRSAASRLIYNGSEKSAGSVVALLWDTALRIEEGNLSMAARGLREAQQDMQALLADPDAKPEDIAAASETLKQALAAYLQEMYAQMQRRGAVAENMDFDPADFAQSVDMEQLGDFFDQLQAQALSGNREAAQQMLARMQQMMDSLDPSLSGQPPPEMRQLMESIAGLRELVAAQEKLLERTREHAGGNAAEGHAAGAPPPDTLADFLPFEPGLFESWGDDGAMPPAPQETRGQETRKQENGGGALMPALPAMTAEDREELRKEQDALRRRLGEIMLATGEQAGKIPDGMQKAENEMRQASTHLEAGRAAVAAAHQEQALEYLKQGQEDMGRQLAAMMKQMTFISFGRGARDPLGRPMRDGKGPSFLPDNSVKVPSEAERKRVKDILDTLRQRSGDYSRPDYERDYYRRLMRQF